MLKQSCLLMCRELIVRCGWQPSIPLSHQACTVKVPLFCYVRVRCIFTVTVNGGCSDKWNILLYLFYLVASFPGHSRLQVLIACSMQQVCSSCTRYLWCISLMLASTLQFHLLCLVGKFWCLPNPKQPTNGTADKISTHSLYKTMCMCFKHIHVCIISRFTSSWVVYPRNFTVEAVSTTMHTRKHAFLCRLW